MAATNTTNGEHGTADTQQGTQQGTLYAHPAPFQAKERADGELVKHPIPHGMVRQLRERIAEIYPTEAARNRYPHLQDAVVLACELGTKAVLGLPEFQPRTDPLAGLFSRVADEGQ